MEHICFEVQLCSEILIFNENSNFWYTDHPEKSALILQSAVCMIAPGQGLDKSEGIISVLFVFRNFEFWMRGSCGYGHLHICTF